MTSLSLFLQVLTCGSNRSGQLGHGDTQDRLHLARLELPEFGGARVVLVACGNRHTLAVTGGGRVYSCGENCFYGQLGHGNRFWSRCVRLEASGGSTTFFSSTACGKTGLSVFGRVAVRARLDGSEHLDFRQLCLLIIQVGRRVATTCQTAQRTEPDQSTDVVIVATRCTRGFNSDVFVSCFGIQTLRRQFMSEYCRMSARRHHSISPNSFNSLCVV